MAEPGAVRLRAGPAAWRAPVPVATLCTVVLAVVYLAAPTVGSDLSAQVARADFFAAHGFRPVDLSWYGGTQPLGYSLVAPPLMALLGVRVAGAFAAVATAAVLTALLVRCGTRRPMLGGLLGGIAAVGNLVSGRVTFGIGVAVACGALLALTADRRARWRLPVAVGSAVLAAATSPVAGLFLGLAATAVVIAAPRLRVDGLLVGAGAAVPMAVMTTVFGDGGWMNISPDDATTAIVVSLAVAVLAYRNRVVMIGALLSAAGVLAAFALHTPVGLNATRLAVMFGAPVVAAVAVLPDRLDRWAGHGLVLAATAGLLWYLPPVNNLDLEYAGGEAIEEEYFEPLVAELVDRRPVGRVEIPPTRHYWESVYVAQEVPIARGWLRQLDIAENDLFFDELPGGVDGTDVPLTADTYRDWLHDTGVSYVAIPQIPADEFAWVGRAEAALINDGPEYLDLVWRNDDWRLYAVADATDIVDSPATLVASTSTEVVFDAPAAGEYPVRVRPLRWLSVNGPGNPTWREEGRWITVTVTEPGRYSVGLRLTGNPCQRSNFATLVA